MVHPKNCNHANFKLQLIIISVFSWTTTYNFQDENKDENDLSNLFKALKFDRKNPELLEDFFSEA